jgi:hypothetical protein
MGYCWQLVKREILSSSYKKERAHQKIKSNLVLLVITALNILSFSFINTEMYAVVVGAMNRSYKSECICKFLSKITLKDPKIMY